jgi:hypothetical protein
MKSLFLIIGIIAAIAFVACENDYPGSLYDPNDTGNSAPHITSVDPPDGSLAGIGVITITGENFSIVKEQNTVYVGKKAGQVMEATQTQIIIQAPDEVGDSLRLRVAVAGALAFSNEILYKLEPAIEEYGQLSTNQTPWGLATDPDGNLYVSVSVGTQSGGIIQVTPDGDVSQYVPPRIQRYLGMKMDTDGYLYLVRNIRLISRVQPGGGTDENWVTLRVGVFVTDIDIDEYGYIWVVGNNTSIFRVHTQTEAVEEFEFTANIRSVRYFNGYLYVSALTSESGVTSSDIWRFPVSSAGELGDREKYFAFSSSYGKNNSANEKATAYAITFAVDGTMFVGTDGPDAIIAVKQDKSWEPLYTGLIHPTGLVFAWGAGPNLFYTRGETGTTAQRVFRINMQRDGAPNY